VGKVFVDALGSKSWNWGIWDPNYFPFYRAADNSTPTTVPTMYMAQAKKLIWTLVELNMKYTPRSAIPKLPAIASFMNACIQYFLSYADRE
jgi:hypothetical protein